MADDNCHDRTVGKGSFTDAPELLLTLFSDPDARGSRRWREVFGQERRQLKRGGPFIAREEPKSSSDC